MGLVFSAADSGSSGWGSSPAGHCVAIWARLWNANTVLCDFPSLYAVLFTLYAVLFSLYTVLLALYAVLFTLYAVPSSLYAVLCPLYVVLSTL